LKPYHNFFLTTAIHRNSFIATKQAFWGKNRLSGVKISYTCVCSWSSTLNPARGPYNAPPDLLAGRGKRRGWTERERGGKREGSETKGKGED